VPSIRINGVSRPIFFFARLSCNLLSSSAAAALLPPDRIAENKPVAS